MENATKAPASRGQLAAIIVTGVVALIAIGFWVYQLTSGLANTNMRQLDSWGLYLTNFMFFVGLSAGGLIISSVPKVFGISGFGPISKVAIWLSIICTCLAGVFIVVDLGQPLRMWELFQFRNMASPLLWDVCVIFSYLIVSIVYLVLVNRYEKGTFSSAAMRVYATVALVLAVMVHSVTAWIFSLQVSHEFWNTALMAPWFVASALNSGLALVMVVCVALRRTGYLDITQADLVKMAKFLGVFILVDLYFFGCDVLTSAYGNDGGREVVTMLFTGQMAPFFWTEIVGGLVAATICFTPHLRTTPLLMVAAGLAILGVFCKRCQIMLGGFGIRNIEMPGIEVHGFALSPSGQPFADVFSWMSYFPSPLEFAITLGVIALGACAFLMGLRWLPLRSAK